MAYDLFLNEENKSWAFFVFNWLFYFLLVVGNIYWIITDVKGSNEKKLVVSFILFFLIYHFLKYAKRIVLMNNPKKLHGAVISLIIAALLFNSRFIFISSLDKLVLSTILFGAITIFWPGINVWIQEWNPTTIRSWRAEHFQQVALCELVIISYRKLVI